MLIKRFSSWILRLKFVGSNRTIGRHDHGMDGMTGTKTYGPDEVWVDLGSESDKTLPNMSYLAVKVRMKTLHPNYFKT